LSGEINTLGYPEAALFSLSCAYMAFNILQCLRWTLEASHPMNQSTQRKQVPAIKEQSTDAPSTNKERSTAVEISLYYIADDVAHTMRGLDAVLSHADREFFRALTPKELAITLRTPAIMVPMHKYTKRRKNPRPPTIPRRVTQRKKVTFQLNIFKNWYFYKEEIIVQHVLCRNDLTNCRT